jgi:hypothetical protein
VTFVWVIRDSDRDAMRTTEAFDSKTSAEEWLRDHWESLLDEGACSVVLRADDQILYEMGLEPA